MARSWRIIGRVGSLRWKATSRCPTLSFAGVGFENHAIKELTGDEIEEMRRKGVEEEEALA